MRHKAFTLVDTKTDAAAGSFEATVAVFGNVDGGGDRIVPGAFTETLARWRLSGDPVPVIFNHEWGSPDAHIGVAYAKDMAQTDKGLHVKGTLDVEDNPVARQVHKLMRRRSLREFSFGYTVPAGGSRRGSDGANELHEIDLIEVGPTLKGMNPSTELHAVKSALAMAPGRTADDDIRRQVDQDVEERVKRYELMELRRECDRLRLEASLGWKPAPRPGPEPEPEPNHVPTMDELRDQAAELGIRVPPPRRPYLAHTDPAAVKAAARDEIRILLGSDRDRIHKLDL